MTHQQVNNSQQQGNKNQKQRKSKKEQEQDIKNAEYIARVGQPNHPNT